MKDDTIIELSTELERPCPYYLGEGMLHHFPRYLDRHSYDRVALVSSRSLFDLFGRDFAQMLAEHGVQPIVVLIEEGEPHKDWQTLSTLCEQLLAAGVTRESIIISLGGGMIGNVVGLAAGLIYRGIRYIEVPTTLMAQTDGVLSNKQAINGRLGKNQFGLYHAPLFIWSDVAYSRRESLRQTRSAVVEGIKNGFVNDAAWLERLAGELRQGLEGVLGDFKRFTLGLIQSKLSIIRQDPTEKGFAIVLEYGHTFGHAIEWLSKGSIYHGEAVAMGMCAAARLSTRLGLTTPDVVQLHEHVIGELLGAPTRIPVQYEPQAIYRAMLSDNKRTGAHLRCLLLERPGRLHNPHGDYMVQVGESDVLHALAGTAATHAQPGGGMP